MNQQHFFYLLTALSLMQLQAMNDQEVQALRDKFLAHMATHVLQDGYNPQPPANNILNTQVPTLSAILLDNDETPVSDDLETIPQIPHNQQAQLPHQQMHKHGFPRRANPETGCYPCEFKCGVELQSIASIERHERDKHRKPDYICSKCKTPYFTDYGYLKHKCTGIKKRS